MNTTSHLAKQPTANVNLAYVPTYHFDRNKPCYCHSGLSFGLCCANHQNSGQTPAGIHVTRNFVSQADCKRFLRFAEKQKRTWLSVVDKDDGKKRTYKKDSGRITQQVHLGKRQDLANSWFKDAVSRRLANLSQARPEWYEAPHLLRYEPGGKYVVHSDAEHYDEQANKFYRFIDRDFSMLIYLNDDYEGGELNFPGLNFTYKPQAGDMVVFPSNHIFSHESLPIRKGNKFALVSWGAFKGSPRISQPRTMIRI